MTGRGPLPLPPRAGPIVDADGHVVEPESAWAAVPERYRPRISADRNGYEHVVVGDTEVLAVPLGTLARPGSTFDDPASFRPLADATPGGSDPVARLGDMDSEGIDQAVLYPTIGLYFSVLEDPAAAVALATAYNDWLAGYCAADPRRLFGAAMLPLQDPAAAARELRRAVGELGLVAGFVRPNPCLGRALSDPAYEPLWDVAEELEVPYRHPRGQFSQYPDARGGPPVQPAAAPRGVPLVRGDARLRPAHRIRDAGAPPGTAASLPGILRRVGSFLARTPGRAGGVLRRVLPRHGAAPFGVLRPAVRHQLRGRRTHAARTGALRRRGPHRLGQRLPAP